MLLIKPDILKESQSYLITPFIYNTFPTSLGFLAGYIREHNKVAPKIIDGQIVDLNRNKIEELLRQDEGPKIVGMSVITINAQRAYRLAKQIKEIDRDYLIVLGGIHATVLPDECLGIPEVDIVIRGEGEKALSELILCLENGRDYTALEGISYKSKERVIHNSKPDLVDLDALPPFPYDLFDSTYQSYRDFGTIISSRGCPYDCIFCSQRAISGQRYRPLPLKRVLDEIDLLINKYCQRKIWFMDDNFLVDKQRTYSLLQGIINRGFHKRAGFVAELRGASATYQALRKMKEANFQIVSFGMESGSQRLLDLVNKQEKVEDNIRAVEMAHQVGMKTSATFIFGLPTETREERLATARLAARIPLDDARFNVAVPYPGTKLFEMAQKEKRLHIEPGWSNFNVQFYMFGDNIPYVPQGADRNRLIRDTFMANLKFCLRPKTVVNFITSPISGGMVLTLPKRWYLAPRQIFLICRLAIFIIRRFFVILLRRGKSKA